MMNISFPRQLKALFWGASLSLAAHTGLFAQKTTPKPNQPATVSGAAVQDTAITRLFGAGAKLQWLRYFRGRLDDVTEVLLTLGYDGAQCRGFMTYGESRERFQLAGTLDGIVLVLDESDNRGMITGHITGTLQSDRLHAEWSNATNTLGSRLEAEEAKSNKPLNQPCGDNKWARRYVARWNNARVDLTLIRTNNSTLNGYLWMEADDRTYALNGKIYPDEHYEIQALLPNGKTAAHLQGSFLTPQATECNWVGSGEKRLLKFSLRSKLPVGCLEYADYTSAYDAVYPRTECADCNQTLDRRVGEWIAQCKTAIAAQKKPLKPEFRSALRASCWYEVTCWTETIFCGYLTFSESWKDQTTGVSFNFDLRTGKEITLDDLFNRGFGAKEWFADYAHKESPKMPKFAEDPKFREWVHTAGFPMFTIRRNGIELSTMFHPVYGQQHLIVPYSILKPYMRRDNPVADLVK
ncbi:MAG: hypothetical protein IPH12_03060 [Saprospirales bacterium]|nr:hypothetical protein [Saprospirales bacterium]